MLFRFKELRAPFWTAALALFLLPIEETLALSSGSILRIANYATIALCLIWLLRSGKSISLSKLSTEPIAWLFAFVFIACASYLWCQYKTLFFSFLITYVFYLLIIFLLRWMQPTEKETEFLLKALYCGGIFASILVCFSSGTFQYDDRSTIMLFGRTVDPNILSISVVFSLNINLFSLLNRTCKKIMTPLLISLEALMLYALVLLGSRGAVIAFLVSTLFSLFTFLRKKENRMRNLLIVLSFVTVLTIAYIILVTQPALGARFTFDNLTGQGEYGSANRLEIWKAAFIAFKKRPILGFGTGSSPYAITETYRYYGTHNSYLFLLVEYGVVGFTTAVLWFAKIFRFCLRKKNKPYICLLITLLVSMLFVEGFTTKVFWGEMLLMNVCLALPSSTSSKRTD